MRDGDVIKVVLDVLPISGPAGEAWQVLVQGVFTPGSALPPEISGAARNIVSVFFGRDMRSVSAFRIEASEAVK